ncbi:MAG: RagB/SusD family nutrient uptake outer membrane protein [Citrobacter freundii]|nr:MAG: RagB/SusD family nutrient uptake outer membrane protein [Citrobacter freundii]
MKKIFRYILPVAATLMFASCKKYVDVPPPQDQLPAEAAFTSDETATATMVGLYSDMNGYNYSFANVLASFMPAMSADEFYSAFTSFDAFKLNSLTPDNSYVNTLWNQPYAYIYHVNAVYEGVTASNSLSAPVKAQLLGEARFMRAFFYFYLVNYFGDVPLVLNTDAKTNTSLPRAATSEVYATIESDLLEAVDKLQNDYQSSERIRPNKAAAKALLARVYLYEQKWSQAETTASEVIGDSRYGLPTDLTRVFLRTSNEAIFQLAAVNTVTGAGGMNTWEGYNIVPASATARSYYVIFDQLRDAFETGDLRKANWTRAYVLSGNTLYCPFKYRNRLINPVVEYTMVLRLGEQYLIRAEARAQQNKLSAATDDLEVIRARAGLGQLNDNLSKDEVLTAVEQERRVELFSEWGHRWFDLKRTGRATALLAPMKTAWQPTDVLYPIPVAAMRTNPNLKQNDGYN